jgi:hypothetical protein
MIVLIMLLAELYPIEKSYMCLVGGEDNVTCFPVDIVLEDKSREAAEKYNMEIKTLNFDDTMYFCSRFIILTRMGFITVGDPLRWWFA